MSFIGATGLNSFQEEIQDTCNYIASRVLEVQSIENVNMTDTSNYTKRLHTELKNEIGYEGSTLTNPPLFGTGLYFRIETQEYLVGNPKVETALGNVPASGVFEKIEDTSNYISRIDSDSSNYVDRVEGELSTRIGYAATITPPSVATGVYVPIGELQGEITTIQEEITTIQGEITTIQEEISGIEGQITALETEVGASTLLDTFTNFWTGTPSIYAGIAAAATLAGAAQTTASSANTKADTAQTTASSANTKADTALTLWNKGTGNYVNNIYHLKTGNVGIGTNTDTILNNKLEVNGSINIATGNKYKINNVDFSYSHLAGTMPIATTINLGGVKPDGTTITIAGDGTISSQGTSPTLQNVYPLFDSTQFSNSTGYIRILDNILGNVGNVNITDLDPPDTYDVVTTEIVNTPLTDSTEPTATPSVPKQIPADVINYQYITLTYESTHPTYSSSVVNNQRIHSIDFPENVVADILVVGGGGCGADATWVGGGGAGGLIYYRKQLQGTYTIKVGKGGGPQDTTEDQQSTINSGKNGKNSEILDSGGNVLFRAIGGSMGTRQIGTGFQIQVFEGGSTGGSGYRDTNPLYSGVGNLSSQNIINGSAVSIINAGGTASNTDRYNNTPYGVDEYGNQYGMFGHRGGTYPSGTLHRGGGGGGAGGVGINGDATLTNSSDGGVGKDMSSIFGTNVGENGWFAGGGGGSGLYDLGVGGMGGGGDGKKDVKGEDGMAGTGGGGGAYTHDAVTTYFTGGSGGSGIVIIRYYVVSSITHKYLAFTTPTTYSVNFPVNTTCDILAINNSQYFKTSGVTLNGSYSVVVGSTSKIQKNSSDLYVPNTNLSITDSITGASITYTTNTPKVIIRYSMTSSTTNTITTAVQLYGYLKYDETANDWIVENISYNSITDTPTIPTNLSQLTGTLPYTSLTGTPTIPSNLSQLSGTLPYGSLTGTPTIPSNLSQLSGNLDYTLISNVPWVPKSSFVHSVPRYVSTYVFGGISSSGYYIESFNFNTNHLFTEYGRPHHQVRWFFSANPNNSSGNDTNKYIFATIFYNGSSDPPLFVVNSINQTGSWTFSNYWGSYGDHYIRISISSESPVPYLNVNIR